MHRIAKFRRLSPWERKVLLRAFVLLPMCALGLRVFGLRRMQAILSPDSPIDECGACGDEASRVGRVLALAIAAARHGPYRASCLPMSLALQRLLREQGIRSELRLGVRMVGGGLEAHAWLERRGQPLTETLEVHARFAAFPAAISPPAGLSR